MFRIANGRLVSSPLRRSGLTGAEDLRPVPESHVEAGLPRGNRLQQHELDQDGGEGRRRGAVTKEEPKGTHAEFVAENLACVIRRVRKIVGFSAG